MKECIILAGGFGTRLQSVINDVPKSMAQVAGKPFLEYLFNYLEKQNFNHVVLSLGYKANTIIQWLETQNRTFNTSYIIEDSPLGTGGAIQYAFSRIVDKKAFIINGDTFYDVDTDNLLAFHNAKTADITIVLKPMADFDRYGSVTIDNKGHIATFNEKQYCKKGLINGGIYIVNKNVFEKVPLPQAFSFEKDVMESHLDKLCICGSEQDSYFIDIGIPADFEKANTDFLKM